VDRKSFEILLTFVVMIVGMGCFTGVLITWIKYRRGKQSASPELMRRLDEIADRVNHMETSIDAVAVEVERISEGQRFTTRLLADRAGTLGVADRVRPGGSTTPH
jgi:K+-sensing histidine kinase KdpD